VKLKKLLKEFTIGGFVNRYQDQAKAQIKLDKGWAKIVNERDEDGKAINETLPAFPKEWKNLQQAEVNMLKAINSLAKAVGKVDRKHEREVSGLGKYVASHLKKFKELLEKEVLNKLQ
jgi:seryl-tRNA synthetase